MGGEGREGRERIHVQQRGLNGWVARHGRGPPGATPQDGGGTGREHRTETRWRCSVVVRACREEGTKRKRKKKRKKKGGGKQTPRSTTRRRDRKGRVARATRRPHVTGTARETAQERGAGEGEERPVLGARNGPRMDEDPVGPRHGVAGGPVGYKHGMRNGMGPQDSPGD